jgi:serine/threonine-protein kinase
MPPAAADRNLLFGILALQLDLIGRDDLIAAMHAWVLDKGRPLGQVLRDQGKLADDEHALLDGLVRKHLAKHGDDPHRSLAALGSTPAVRDDLARLGDADVQASLAALPTPDGPATGPYVPPATLPPHARFLVLRPHARGGLGEVFVARDQELNREVALKEIQPRHADDPASRARFLLEAEVTGQLEHPGVVPVYGLGSYADGRPFYAMRFVKGDNLQEAIKRFHQAEAPGRDPGERALALRGLLGRFVDVCNAVAYAHSRGVLHRDLKPGNIMLGKYGETLIVDWGLAKPLDRPEPAAAEEPAVRPGSGSSPGPTRAGAAVGTPAYMSPEQAAGRHDQLGPASDIYGLGATLYTLLTGQSPLPGEDTAEVLRQVQRGAIEPPRRRKPGTPGALEAVCLKAMALRPADRYPSALALAADVEHWLADEPVTAHRDRLPARLGRWARRHRPLVAGAAALLVAAVVGLSAGALLLARANAQIEQQRQEAERQRQLAGENFRDARQAVDEYLTRVSEDRLLKSPLPGLQPLRKELLQLALKYYQGFARRRGDDSGLRAELAAAQLRMGTITAQVGSKEQALEILRTAVTLYEALEQDAAARRGLAKCYHQLGSTQADIRAGGNALASFRKALALWRGLLNDDPRDEALRFGLVRTTNSMALVLNESREARAALRSYQDTLAVLEPLARDHPKNTEYANLLGGVYHNIGLVYYVALDQPGETVKFVAKAIAIQERLAGESPTDPIVLSFLGNHYGLMGDALEHLGRLDEAVTYYGRALRVRERLAHANPTVTTFQAELAINYRIMGRAERMQGKPQEALPWFDKAIAILEKLVHDNPTSMDFGKQLGLLYNSTAQVYLLTDRKRALELTQKAAAIYDRLGREHPADFRVRLYGALFLANAGDLQRRLDQPEAALRSCRQARTVLQQLARDGPSHSEVRQALAESCQVIIAVWNKVGARQPQDLYELAGACAELSTLVEPDKGPESTKLADQAIKALRRAVAAGFTDVARLHNDPVLAPLRSRDDFRGLAKGLEERK